MANDLYAEASINAPASAVWAVMDDFGNIADYTASVKTSELTSSGPVGVGTTRHCDFSGPGTADEEVLVYEPEKEIKIKVDMKGAPVKGSITTFTLTAIDENTTRLEMSAELITGRIVGKIIGGRLAKRLPGQMETLLGEIGAAAQKKAAAA